MRVHESGKVTLEWGGLNFIVNKGIDVRFLQEVVSTKVTPPEERVNEDEGEEAMSFGSVNCGRYCEVMRGGGLSRKCREYGVPRGE